MFNAFPSTALPPSPVMQSYELDSSEQQLQIMTTDWVIFKGKRIRSRVRKVRNKVMSKFEDPKVTSNDEGNDEITKKIAGKESALHRAMTLNEDLASATKEKRQLKQELEVLQSRLQLMKAKIEEIRKNDDFMDVEAIGRLYAEIVDLRRTSVVALPRPILTAAEEGISCEEETLDLVLCSGCSNSGPYAMSSWCSKCGYYTCGNCCTSSSKQQCPRCLEKDIDEYSCGGDSAGRRDSEAILQQNQKEEEEEIYLVIE